MQYRTLGRTGAQVSVIGLGAEHLVDKPQQVVNEVVAEALDHGVNYMDLFMAQAEVRSAIGKALGGRRDRMMIAGHLGACLTPDGQYIRSRDLAQSKAHFEDLLTRLDTDYIDVLMLHFVDEPEDLDVVLEGPLALAKQLQREGKARYIGMSSHVPAVAKRMVDTGSLDALMFSMNPYFDTLPASTDIDTLFAGRPAGGGTDPMRLALYQACEKMGCGIVVMKAFGAGVLLSPNNPAGMAMTPSQCIAYALSRPGVSCCLAGCKTAEEIRQALHYLEATDEERDYADVVAGAYTDMQGQCMYCNHCLPCPQQLDIAALNRLGDAARHEGVNERLRAAYGQMARKADGCIACGACVRRCPFHVPVPEKMADTHALLGA